MCSSDLNENVDNIVGRVVGRESGSVLVRNRMVQKASDHFNQDVIIAYKMAQAFVHRYNMKQIQQDIDSAVIGTVPGIQTVRITWDAEVSSTRGLPGRQEIPGVRNAVAISAGKGGVGKTTVAVNVAIALRLAGARVGLLDADVYGDRKSVV